MFSDVLRDAFLFFELLVSLCVCFFVFRIVVFLFSIASISLFCMLCVLHLWMLCLHLVFVYL